ncbi:MAG TPA: hypothetical protein VFT85_02485, partial [Acidimicrobiia bacterium]|nr:hypothetical protein [Acidimicrobiia bacterium]
QLVAYGLSPSIIDRRVNEGVLTPVVPGVYVVFPARDDTDLLRGAVLALPDAVVSHHSAAHLLDFPRLPERKPTVVVPSHTTHRFPDVTVRRCNDLVPGDVTEVDGLPVTSVTRTLFDLSRLLRFREFDAIGESLIISGMMELGNFDDMTERLARRGKGGSRFARLFLEIRSGHESKATVLERKGREVLAGGGLPKPEAQHPIPWAPTRRFDDAYPDARLAIEWDSRAWHQQRAAMTADRRRDREAAAHGWVVVRLTWDEITETPHESVSSVGSLLRDRRTAV